MKGIVVYGSKYGSTLKYANWIGEKYSFDTISDSDVKLQDLKEYDVIIFGGGLYAGGIKGIKILQKFYDNLFDKKILVFAVGASASEDEKSLKEVKKHNLSGKLSDIPLFYCRGAWDLESMNFVDKIMCKALIKSVEKKPYDSLDKWSKDLLDNKDKKLDWTDEKYLEPLYKKIKDF